MMRTEFPDEYLCQIYDELICDPDLGEIYYKNDPERSLGYLNHGGYYVITFKGRNLRRNRLMWFFVYGEFPSERLDHINGIRTDDSIDNLRISSASLNSANMANTLGYSMRYGRFQARIKFDGKYYNLGTYDNPQDAQAAYMDAKSKLYPGEKFRPPAKIPEAHLTIGHVVAKTSDMNGTEHYPVGYGELVVNIEAYIEEILKFETEINKEMFYRFTEQLKRVTINATPSMGVQHYRGEFYARRRIGKTLYHFGTFGTPEEAQACYITNMKLAGIFDPKLLLPISADHFGFTPAKEREAAYEFFNVTAEDLPNLMSCVRRKVEEPARVVPEPRRKAQMKTPVAKVVQKPKVKLRNQKVVEITPTVEEVRSYQNSSPNSHRYVLSHRGQVLARGSDLGQISRETNRLIKKTESK